MILPIGSRAGEAGPEPRGPTEVASPLGALAPDGGAEFLGTPPPLSATHPAQIYVIYSTFPVVLSRLDSRPGRAICIPVIAVTGDGERSREAISPGRDDGLTPNRLA